MNGMLGAILELVFSLFCCWAFWRVDRGLEDLEKQDLLTFLMMVVFGVSVFIFFSCSVLSVIQNAI